MRSIFTSASTLLLVSGLAAQGFDNDIGVGLGPLGDDALVTQTLMHSFTFPGGTSTTSIDIDTNGRVIPTLPTNTSVAGESVPLLFTEPPSVCAYWDDLTPAGLQNRGEIYFNTTPNKTVITWCNTKRFGVAVFDHNDFTFQIQLYADGRIVMARDNRAFSTNTIIVGISAGNNTADPGEVDFSTAPFSSNGQPSIYEAFGVSDLVGQYLEFVPDGIGGYNVARGPSGITPCGAEKFGTPSPVSYEFFPTAPGGPYFVSKTNAAFFDDAGMGTTVTFAGDDSITAPLPLGFTFTWPGGTPSTTVSIDNNGRCLISTPPSSNCCPEVNEILAGPASINAFWTDLSSQLGDCRIFTDPNANPPFAAITWEDVPMFAESLTHTFQVVMRGDGSFALNYRNVSNWQTGSGIGGDNVVIGCSQGEDTSGVPAPDPGQTDFAGLPVGGLLSTTPTIYEYWDAGDGLPAAQVEVPDIQMVLWPWITDGSSAINRTWSEPRIGQPYSVQIEGHSTGNISTVLAMSVAEVNVPLDFFGLPGMALLVDPIIAVLPMAAGPDRTLTFTFTIPMGSSAGIPLVMQGHAIAPTESPNPALPAILTNGVRGIVRN